MQIDSLPEGVIARIERPAICVELIRKYEDEFFLCSERLFGICVGRSVFIYQSKIVWKQRNLASSVNPAEVETTLRGLGFPEEVAEDRIS
jgi:hypothetical protein